MPSRLRERFAAIDEAWPLQVALFKGLCQTILGSAHIAHRREPALQHARQHPGRSRRDIGRRPLGQRGKVCGDGGHMDMGIDQTRHQGHATQVKALRIAGLHVGPSDLQNALSLHEDRAISKIVTALGIQDLCVPKKIACHLSFLLPPVPGTSGRVHRCPAAISEKYGLPRFLFCSVFLLVVNSHAVHLGIAGSGPTSFPHGHTRSWSSFPHGLRHELYLRSTLAEESPSFALQFSKGRGISAFLPEPSRAWNEPVELFQRKVQLVAHPMAKAARRVDHSRLRW
jgi:hypothetical protein